VRDSVIGVAALELIIRNGVQCGQFRKHQIVGAATTSWFSLMPICRSGTAELTTPFCSANLALVIIVLRMAGASFIRLMIAVAEKSAKA